MNNKYRLQSICALTAWLVSCFSSQAVESREIQADIDHLLGGLGHKADRQAQIERVVKHGTNAVPLLIERYTRTEQERRWPLATCLCQIPTIKSLDFLKDVLRTHEDRQATSEVIRRFPLEHEDQITLLLIDLLEVTHQSFEAQERLRKMIFRKPGRAGVLVRAMGSSGKSVTGRNKIGEVLAYNSGYSHTWGVWQHEFWTAWWERNKDKEPLDWLVETFRSDPKNDSRRAEALQVLGSLKDPRSVPVLLEGLGSESERVQYWAVVGLQRLDGTLKPSGYRWETFQQEQMQVIEHLKQKFCNQGAQQSGPANGSQPIRSETNRTSSAAGSRR
jgi:hypothetical protein